MNGGVERCRASIPRMLKSSSPATFPKYCVSLGGGRLDRLVHRYRKITDGAVVLIRSKSTCDVDSIEQPLAGRDLGECCRRRMAVCVDSECGPVATYWSLQIRLIPAYRSFDPTHIKFVK